MNSKSYTYNESFFLKYIGQFDLSMFKVALSMVAERQPALRSLFMEDSTTRIPFKLISPNFNVDISQHVAIPGELEGMVTKLVTHQACQPFDLCKGPLIRLIYVTGNLLIITINLNQIDVFIKMESENTFWGSLCITLFVMVGLWAF